jgi:hypothetical protein
MIFLVVVSTSAAVEEDLGPAAVKVANIVFAAFFLLEVGVRLWCTGLVRYFTDPVCFVDFAVSIVDVVFLVGQEVDGSGMESGNGSAARVGRMLRMIRLLRLSRFLRITKAIHKMIYGRSVEQKRIQQNRDAHADMQRDAAEWGVLELVLQACESRCVDPDTRVAATELGHRLLEYGNTFVQDRLLERVTSDANATASGNGLLGSVAAMMQRTVSECELARSDLGTAPVASDGDGDRGSSSSECDRYQVMAVTFRFLQSMCEGHHAGMQNWLRDQPGAMRPVNVLELAAQTFCSVCCDESVMGTKLGYPELKLLDSILAFLIETVQGPNTANQAMLVDGTPMVGMVVRLLGTRLRGVHEVSPRNSSGVRELQDPSRRQLFGGSGSGRGGGGGGGEGGSPGDGRGGRRHHPLAFVYSAKSLKVRCAEFLDAVIEGVTDQHVLDRVCDYADTSVIKKRMESIFLLDYYVTKNKQDSSHGRSSRGSSSGSNGGGGGRRAAAVTEEEKQLILNADPDGWDAACCREGELLMILIKRLGQASSAFESRARVDTSELGSDIGYFCSYYDRAVGMFYELKAMRAAFDSEVIDNDDDDDDGGGAPKSKGKTSKSEAALREIFAASARVLKLFGVPACEWRGHRELSKRRGGGLLESNKWQEEYHAAWSQCRRVHDQAVQLRARVFFDARIRSVEINWNGELHRIFFPLPHPSERKFVATIRPELLRDVETGTSEDKLAQFVERCKARSEAMPFLAALDSVRLLGGGGGGVFGLGSVSLYDCVGALDALEQASFAVALANALVMLICLEYPDGGDGGGGGGQAAVAVAVYHARWAEELNRGLGIAQLIMCIVVAGIHTLKRFPSVLMTRFRAYTARTESSVAVGPPLKEAWLMAAAVAPPVLARVGVVGAVAALVYARYGWVKLFVAAGAGVAPLAIVYEARRYCDDPASYGALVFVTLADLLGDPVAVFNFGLIAACVAGLAVWEFFYALCLFKAVTLFPAITNAVKAVYIPAKSLTLTFALAVIVIYVFSLWGFYVFPATFTLEDTSYCGTMTECFWFVLHMGFLSGAGIPGDGVLADEGFIGYNDGTGFAKMLFDLAFWVIVTICIVNMVFGIMLDTFAALREQHDESSDLLSNYCFVCCLHRAEFPSLKQFVRHQDTEHNLLDYVYFITYVECAKETDRNGYQDYVHAMIEDGDVQWMPINKSISLGKTTDDEGEGGGASLGSIGSAVETMAAKLDSVVEAMGSLQGRLAGLEQQVAAKGDTSS